MCCKLSADTVMLPVLFLNIEMPETYFDFLIFFTTVNVFVTYFVCSKLLALHFVNGHVSVTCDRPSPTVLMTADNDLFGIEQESLFGKQELLYSNGL